ALGGYGIVSVAAHLIGRQGGRLLPGVEDLLAGLQALPHPPVLGLLTGNIRLGAEIKLRHYNLWHHFVVGAFGDDHEDRNRLSAIARERAARHLGEEPSSSQILVVGDTPHDIACARAIGAPCLAVATGGATMDELRVHAPEWLVEDLRQVRAEELCA
ncbi:MAG: HAD hydrolase-like protein, partial [Pedosphaera parvula]|nr:HAD hydrolase-like protein [Pedosphaera parvula]